VHNLTLATLQLLKGGDGCGVRNAHIKRFHNFRSLYVINPTLPSSPRRLRDSHR
jgi:hypothetical protein